MSTSTPKAVTPSDIRLARALVRAAPKEGLRESAQIEAIARIKTPEERKAS